jgi:four helix bundle protein
MGKGKWEIVIGKMKEDNVVLEKSYALALRMVKLYGYLTEEKREFVLSKQILRSGTSIGANMEEAVGAQSEKDFLSKISIGYKEARETKYWLRLLNDSGYLEEEQAQSLFMDIEEMLKLLGSINPEDNETKNS